MTNWVRTLTIYLGSIVLVGAAVFVVWSRHGGEFPLEQVDVALTQYVDSDEVKCIAEPFLEQGFFGLNVGALQQEIEQVPWVKSVAVRRRWPDRVMVSIQEHTAQARWGKSGILSTDGVVFYPDPSQIPSNVPTFVGEDGQEKRILGQYLESLAVLAPIGLSIESIDLSAQDVWNIVLGNNIRLVLSNTGFQDALTRFVLVYPNKLQAQSHRIAYIDLRYTNGFAIGWKEPAANQ